MDTDTPADERERRGDAVLAYHQRTKHRFDGFAAGPGGLDWANQPDPFRVFDGCPQLPLPLAGELQQPGYAELYRPGAVPARPLDLAGVAALLELALGLSAWKQYGDSRWALRCNPSSGNLHPTEAYLVSGGEALPAGVHHYVSRDHLLEQRCRLVDAVPASALPEGSLLLGLSSIHWREAWKYGERAYRYCQHDVGHAMAAVRYAAAVLGWRVRWLADWGDEDIAALLGLDRSGDFGAAEAEHPDLLLQVDTGADAPAAERDALLAAMRQGDWQGRANRLSAAHGHDWPVIDEVAAAAGRPRGAVPPRRPDAPLPAPLDGGGDLPAATLIRQRRSAQALDGVSGMDAVTFYRMLDMTLPRTDTPPWDMTDGPTRLHLLLFVHRVDGLAPGLYLLLRSPEAEPGVREAIGRDLDWAAVPGAPAHLQLYRLLSTDAREAAQILSCHQDIAADGAFSLAMLAEFRDNVADAPWVYRELFWEAGMIGQVLYLEAEAAGLRGTGIGCFFDDGVHDMLALGDQTLQSLYHFTVGGALTDTRLQTLPPYAHLAGRESPG